MPPMHIKSKSQSIKDEEKQPLSDAHDVDIKQGHPNKCRTCCIRCRTCCISFLRWTAIISSIALVAFFVGFYEGKQDMKSTPKKDKHKLDVRFDPENYERFIIFSQQRSGSGYLRSLMNNHTMILCGREELYNKYEFPENDIESYMKMVNGAFTELLGRNKHRLNTVTHVGFKIMYDQGLLEYDKELLLTLNNLGIKVIHVIRQNKLRQYISNSANHENHLQHPDHHKAHPTNEEDIKVISEIQVDGSPEKVLRFLDRKSGQVENVTSLLETYLEPSMMDTVKYEDLSEDSNTELHGVFDFLGVPMQEVQTDLLKIHKDKKIHKYFDKTDQDELRKALKKSKYSWMLENW